ncbi:unnamed protein product [Lupinus luteus]|uniref:MULE transposase domain-containing protein n=1 Tax=Lupinus luteus TaxID=3873 RepID=A0AAV1WZM7_LUPLU
MQMVIIRDIVTDFSEDEDIELCNDDTEVTEPGCITFSNPSSFFVNVDYSAGKDIDCSSSHLSTDVDNELCLGMQFDSKEATISAIKHFHFKNSFDYIVCKCVHFGAGCEWRIRVCKSLKREMWEVRKISGRHTCVSTNISQDHTKLSSSFIADCVMQLVTADPGIPMKALMKEVVSRFGYTVTYRKAWKAKQIAMSRIYGDWEGSYKELPRWFNVVQWYLPGTVVRYGASNHDNIDTYILDRVFWSFKSCIDDFGFCKPILQVDGTFLTGKYNGTLLIASSQDGNRRIFPIAFAIVEGETKEA